MDPKQTVMALYGAYATGDTEQITGLLTPNARRCRRSDRAYR
jgi:hypothetical protein